MSEPFKIPVEFPKAEKGAETEVPVQFFPEGFLEAAERGDDETIKAGIDKISNSEFEHFVESLPSTSLRYRLSQGVVDKIIERELSLLEEQGWSRKFKDQDIIGVDGLKATVFSRAFLPGEDYKSESLEDESPYNKAFRSLVKFYSNHPYAGHEMIKDFLQESLIRPDIVIEEITNVFWRQNRTSWLKQDLLYSFQYLYPSNKDAFDKAILDNLDFNRPENFTKTAAIIDFLRQFLSDVTLERGRFDWGEPGGLKKEYNLRRLQNHIPEAISSSLERGNSNYLLRCRAEELSSPLGGRVGNIEKSDDLSIPFEISKNRYGYIEDNTLFVSRTAEDVSFIKELIQKTESIRLKINRIKMTEIRSNVSAKLFALRGEETSGRKFEFSAKKDLHVLSVEREKVLEEIKTHLKIAEIDDFRLLGGRAVSQEEGDAQLFDYAYLMRPRMSKIIERQFEIDIHSFSEQEQFQFLQYVKTKGREQTGKVQTFCKTFGETGFKTFLSLEYGKELGDDIIALGEKLPKEEAGRLFAKYGELVDAATEAETSLREHFPEAKLSPELVEGVRESLLRRGRDMLVSFAAEVKVAKNVGYEQAIPHLERELSLLRGGAALFAAGFKELSRRGEKLNLSELKGDIGFEQEVLAESFSEADRERMRELYRINYAEYPEFQKMCVEKLNEVLSQNDSQFFVLRYKGVIEGFYRLGVTDHDAAYFGAFNMNPKYAGSGIGEALMQQSLDVKAKDFVIVANCIADKSIAANYIERGFICTHTKQVHEPHLMYITRHDAQNSMFPTKALADEEIIRVCGTETGYVCKRVPIDAVTHVDLALLDERSEDGTRHVLTRYIRDKKSQSAYLVFEKTTDLAIENFSRPETSYRV